MASLPKWIWDLHQTFAFRLKTRYVSSLANLFHLTKVWWQHNLTDKSYKNLYSVLRAFTFFFRSAFQKRIIRNVHINVLLCLVPLDPVIASCIYIFFCYFGGDLLLCVLLKSSQIRCLLTHSATRRVLFYIGVLSVSFFLWLYRFV